MKVGIYFSGSLQDSGGGYTYEQEILGSLLHLAHTSGHSYVIFSPADISDILIKSSLKNISSIRLSKNSFFAKILEHLYFSVNFPFFNILYFKFLPIQTEIRKNNIDFMVFLQWKHGIVDIPSITPVWDLQHRLQPWFPEVSGKGEWDNREKYYQKVLGRSSIILTGTSAGQEEVSQFYNIPKDRIKVLPLPTPSDALANQKEKNRETIKKFPIAGDYLLYPAQFWPHKNHVACIKALNILHHHYHQRVSLVFVGSDKKNLPYIRDYARCQNVSEYIHFLGFIPREDLMTLYQNAFALVFPTFFGPDNIPPLEAFALRCPVIASKVNGADEQLGDAALLFDPQNPREIAEFVNSLYTDPALRIELIEKGLIRAKQWTSDDYVRKIFSLLDEFENIRKCWE
jgi:glycosyltransferase involved in cell wall biosynthesis